MQLHCKGGRGPLFSPNIPCAYDFDTTFRASVDPEFKYIYLYIYMTDPPPDPSKLLCVFFVANKARVVVLISFGSNHIPTHNQNYRGAWSLTQQPRTAQSATRSTSTLVCAIISVSECHRAKQKASVSIVNCADNGTNVSFRFAHPRFVSVYKSTTRRINARRTHRTLKCSLVERPAQLFACTVAL